MVKFIGTGRREAFLTRFPQAQKIRACLAFVKYETEAKVVGFPQKKNVWRKYSILVR